MRQRGAHHHPVEALLRDDGEHPVVLVPVVLVGGDDDRQPSRGEVGAGLDLADLAPEPSVSGSQRTVVRVVAEVGDDQPDVRQGPGADVRDGRFPAPDESFEDPAFPSAPAEAPIERLYGG